MANYGGLTMPSEIPASKLTFVSKDQAVATVSESGEITAVGAGNTNIEVTATSKPSLSAVASVEVIAG
jgi:lactocepin